MTTVANTLPKERGFSVFVRNHPLIAYFFLAYAGMWIVISPLVMDSFGLIEISDGLSLLLFVLSSLSGPALAAFRVTGILVGRAGMARLLRRVFQVRAGLQWYAVALFIFLAIWLAAYSFLYAGAPIRNLIANPSLLLSAFLPSVIMGLIIPSIGEEPGWRGFALPRLQAAYGPVIATLILGTLHGVWHLPALFTPLLGPFSIEGFITFVLTAAAGTFIYTQQRGLPAGRLPDPGRYAPDRLDESPRVGLDQCDRLYRHGRPTCPPDTRDAWIFDRKTTSTVEPVTVKP
jgi:membrane protease YdiL (CAAX protease family)